MSRFTRIAPRLLLIALTCFAAVLAAGSNASAAGPEPRIQVTTLIPDNVFPGHYTLMYVSVHNDGQSPMSGNLTFTYTLPVGFTVSDPRPLGAPPPSCVQSGQEDECTIDVNGIPPGHVMPYEIASEVPQDATGVLSGTIEISGGGAPNAVQVPISLETSPIGPFELKSFDVTAEDGPTLPGSQAGSHPAALSASFESNSASFPVFEPGASLEPYTFVAVSSPENFRNVITHVPAGVVGYPTATGAKCTSAEINVRNPAGQYPICPRDSQIGNALLNGKDVAPVYNMVPPEGVPAEFAIFYEGVIVNLRARVRPGDDGIDLITEKAATTTAAFAKVEVTLWGTPADHSHDNLRAECTEERLGASGNLCPSLAAKTPFLRQPTSCSGAPLPWEIEMDTYQRPGIFHRRSTTTPPITGCDTVPFEPKLSLAPTADATHSTSGLDLELAVPQGSGAEGISQADLREVSLAFPPGVSLNPAAAEGLSACTDAQLRLGLEGPSDCPEASKLGTVSVDTPLLEKPIEGSVFLRSQASQDAESGQMYRLGIELRSDERGVDVKLPGSLLVNKATGQVTSTFDELPQLPFETMHLHLKAGPRAPLTTPQACGTYAGQATLSGWNGKTVSLAPEFNIDQGCDTRGFGPGFEAGVGNPTAGAFSPFTLRVTRDPGMPNLSRISATLPEGELAKLAGVPVCSDAQAATGACPASSRIGKVVSAVGEGSSPIYLPQPGKAPTAVYLAGPYKGAPYSVVAAVPAQSGPFDLGTVVVRSALRIDPETVQATVASDPLPQIFGGIPVSYRDVRVEVDRPGFTLNPTDCEPTAVTGTIEGSGGQSAAVSDRFQVGDCASLRFKPRLTLKLSGQTNRTGNPALTAVLRTPQKGASANIARTVVTLPHSEFVAEEHLADVCTRVQYAEDGGGGGGCPPKSVYGRAVAYSPLLERPLAGKVYLRSNGGARTLPDLVASLDGQIHVDLVGYVSSDKKTGGLKTTFARVPDAPVSRFVLKMGAGKHSLLENSTDICHGTRHAKVSMSGQNGARLNLRPTLQVRCAKRS